MSRVSLELMKLVTEGGYRAVTLHWCKPKPCPSTAPVVLSNYAACHGIYRFEREHHLASNAEVVRIGIAYDQTIQNRVLKYNESELAEWRRRGSLWISYAEFEYDGGMNRQVYEDIEHLLIYFTQPAGNVQKRAKIPTRPYLIQNEGHRGVFPREVLYPLAAFVSRGTFGDWI